MDDTKPSIPPLTALSKDELIAEIERLREALQSEQGQQTELPGVHELFMDTMNALPIGFAIYDADETLIARNQEYAEIRSSISDLLEPGLKFEDFVRASISSGDMVLGGLDPEKFIEERIAQFRDPQSAIHRQFANGRWIMIQEAKIPNGQTVIVETDITHMKETERELDRARMMADAASRTKTDFLAQMTHELRNPLNAILGFSDLFVHKRLGPLDDPKYLDFANAIHEAGERLNNLISDILDVSRIQSGEIELMESRVGLDATLRACMEMITEKTDRDSLDLSVVNKAGDIWIMGDEKRLRQILMQLLWNAVSFTPDGGHIEVEARRMEDQGLEILVRDSGIGISQVQLKSILEPFVKSERLRRSSPGGTGLGLPIAKALAEMHDGNLRIKSIEGKGTTVTVILPAARVQS